MSQILMIILNKDEKTASKTTDKYIRDKLLLLTNTKCVCTCNYILYSFSNLKVILRLWRQMYYCKKLHHLIKLILVLMKLKLVLKIYFNQNYTMILL